MTVISEYWSSGQVTGVYQEGHSYSLLCSSTPPYSSLIMVILHWISAPSMGIFSGQWGEEFFPNTHCFVWALRRSSPNSDGVPSHLSQNDFLSVTSNGQGYYETSDKKFDMYSMNVRFFFVNSASFRACKAHQTPINFHQCSSLPTFEQILQHCTENFVYIFHEWDGSNTCLFCRKKIEGKKAWGPRYLWVAKGRVVAQGGVEHCKLSDSI